jgi:16S rRNA (guanine966-N2)-methyltransferase
LVTPVSADVIRPTADRVRETLFNVLGQWCEGLVVLDLFAGTGALAFEALSRGAVRATLVDQHHEAQALIRTNAEALRFVAQIELLCSPVARALEQLARRGPTFDLVFVDPPYRLQACLNTLQAVQAVVTPGARVVVEHGKEELLPLQVGRLEKTDERAFGATVVSTFSNSLTGP